MTGGLPSFPQGRFPDDLPPTIFSPASPKVKAVEATKAKDIDAESMASQATFSSTVSLLKNSMKSKFARKDAEVEKKPSSKKSLPKDIKTHPVSWQA